MFLVMNRFRVNPGREDDFEAGWRGRQSHLKEFAGFLSFYLLRGESSGDGPIEFISHTTWRSRADFEAWRGSEAFTRAHAQGSVQGILAGPPVASVYEVVVEETNQPAAETKA
jgi:heme-degrading monooxygenase HmoA